MSSMKSTSNKRPRLAASASEETRAVPALISASSSPPSVLPLAPAASISFRNVSACNRCRQRKNRCDQKLPFCLSCEKAGVKCVGFDPLTKREIPRTYVYYLESRVNYLEMLLSEHDIPFSPAEEFDLGAKVITEHTTGLPSRSDRSIARHDSDNSRDGLTDNQNADASKRTWERKQDELNNLASNIGMVSVQGASDPRYLGSTSGISFARVVFAAVRSSVSGSTTERDGTRVNKPGSIGSAAAASRTSKRDQFLRLQTKPTITPAPFPTRDLGMRLVNLYFEHANPQIPTLHRGEFMTLFERAYASKPGGQSPRELYMLNIVFAIGAGIILEGPSTRPSASSAKQQQSPSPVPEKRKISSQQKQPEEYHASAVKYLDSLGSTTANDQGFGGGLEELQAVLLLAGFALLRPVSPGLWYITGFAVRLAVDLGLHYEDGSGIDNNGDNAGPENGHDVTMGAAGGLSGPTDNDIGAEERGRRQWIRDLRRRLWWCVYSFDRLVSTCVGRPFGITDQVITTNFPSVLDDIDITTSGFRISSRNFNGASYKRVSHHYFRLRLLQSEILHVLQYRQAQKAHENTRHRNPYMHSKTTSSFLQPFDSFQDWRRNIDSRLRQWKNEAPLQEHTAVGFSVQFLELNYWQALIMLYRQSLSVPPTLSGELNPSEDFITPSSDREESEDEEEIYNKLAISGRRVLELYRELHRVHLVNYTYLATVHIFMAGIAFLYALWHSSSVRTQLNHEEVESTIQAATSILGDLMSKCPPAEACRDALERMSKATLKMCLFTTGLGSRAANHYLDFQPKADHDQTQYPALKRNDNPQQGFPGNLRSPRELGQNLQVHYPEIPQHGRPSSNSIDGRSDTTQPGFRPTSSSQPLQYQERPNTSAQPCDYFSNLAQQSQSIHTTAPFTAADVPDDSYDFTSNEFDFLAMDDESMGPYQGNFGLHLGYDAEHDWSEGAQPELFGDFFFGGAGNPADAG